MTCREKLTLEHPELVDIIYASGCKGCPNDYGYLPPNETLCILDKCRACWDREIPEEGSKPGIKDSGERTEFSTGAVRDMHGNKGDMVSLPWESLLRLSRHYEAGAKKYKRWNYRLGIPVSSLIDSACRHLAKYLCGCDDEDHLSAAAFNILGAMLMEETMPETVDLPLREGKNRFQYFSEKGDAE